MSTICQLVNIRIYIKYFFFFNGTETTELYTRPYTLSLHDALPISRARGYRPTFHHHTATNVEAPWEIERMRSEEHTSELQSHGLLSYAVFCLKKKKPKRAEQLVSHSVREREKNTRSERW